MLVVDDEVLVRMDLVDMLSAAGYRTREACCAAEGIEILERHADVRIVFTDIQMPGTMDGLALSHYIRTRWPPTVIVVVSGNLSPKQCDVPESTKFMAKPFSASELDHLLKKIEAELAESGS